MSITQALLAQSQISSEVLDRMLEARLSQLMGVGFVIISVVILVVLALFWRMMNGQDTQIKNNGTLIEKLGTLPSLLASMAEQNNLLRKLVDGTDSVKTTNGEIAAALTKRAGYDDDTQRDLKATLQQVTAFNEGRATAVEGLKTHMDENAKTVDERLISLEKDTKEIKQMLTRLLTLLEPAPPPAADVPAETAPPSEAA